jgi:endonuclease III
MKIAPPDVGAKLARIDERLQAAYGGADLGNFEDPLAETIYILLSLQTRETVYRRVFHELSERWTRWVDVLAADPADVEAALRPAGFHHRRAATLLRLLRCVEDADRERGIGPFGDPPGDLTLEFLRTTPTPEAERFLLSLPGIGPKSARCVLSYSLGRPAFAVDTHVARIFERLELDTRSLTGGTPRLGEVWEAPGSPRGPLHFSCSSLCTFGAHSQEPSVDAASLRGGWGFQPGPDVVYAEPGDLRLQAERCVHRFWNATNRPAPCLDVSRRPPSSSSSSSSPSCSGADDTTSRLASPGRRAPHPERRRGDDAPRRRATASSSRRGSQSSDGSDGMLGGHATGR